MIDHDVLGMLRWLQQHVREVQETAPVDEALANRLQRVGDELAEMEQMARRSRPVAARGVWAMRRAFRRVGMKAPPMPRSAAPQDRGKPGTESIVFSSAPAGACLACGEEVGAGPIGWCTEPEPGPLCDDCLNERCTELRVVLMVANLLRELVEMGGGSEEEEMVRRRLLGTSGTALEQSIFEAWAPQGTMTEEELIGLLEEIGEGKQEGGDR